PAERQRAAQDFAQGLVVVDDQDPHQAACRVPALASVAARPWQSYSVVVAELAPAPPPVAAAVAVELGSVTFVHASATAAIAASEPVRVSPGRPPKPVARCSPTTQRILPAATSCASQDAL